MIGAVAGMAGESANTVTITPPRFVPLSMSGL